MTKPIQRMRTLRNRNVGKRRPRTLDEREGSPVMPDSTSDSPRKSAKSLGPQIDTQSKEYRNNKLFRRIEADIKERERKRVPGDRVDYVDSTKNITCSLGIKDVKTSLRRARMPAKKDAGGTILLDEEGNQLATFMEQAKYELGRGNAALAKVYLDKAVCMDPAELLVLIERGKCLVKMGQPRNALLDVDPVLKDNPYHAMALLVKADALYQLSDFEHSLVYYHRGLKHSTQDTEVFRLGIRRAEEAVDNSIGSKVKDYFDNISPLVLDNIPTSIFQEPWDNIADTGKKVNTKDTGKKKDNAADKKEKRRKAIEKKEARKAVLGPMYREVVFLEQLASNATDVGLGKVAREANEAIGFLKAREDFWRQHNPIAVKNVTGL